MKNYFNNAKQSLTRSIAWLMLIGVIVLSLAPLPSMPQSIPNSDKLLHLATYFGLSYWFFHTYCKRPLTIVFGFMLLGIALECSQAMTPHRLFEWLDLLMNVSGVFLAWLIFWRFKIRVKWLLVG
jgi:VanZ family protein